MDEHTCIITECGQPIPQRRMEMWPTAITCSAECSRVHKKNLRRVLDRQWMRDKRGTEVGNYKVLP